MTHICVGKLTIIGSDNGLSPGRHQAIIWTNAGILLIRHLGTNLSEILIEVLAFSFKKMRLKVSSAKRRPFCLGLNVLRLQPHIYKGKSVITDNRNYKFCILGIATSMTDLYGHTHYCLNTLRLRQDGRLFPEDIFKCIFFNENV